jgi:hypothetical protein
LKNQTRQSPKPEQRPTINCSLAGRALFFSKIEVEGDGISVFCLNVGSVGTTTLAGLLLGVSNAIWKPSARRVLLDQRKVSNRILVFANLTAATLMTTTTH